MVTPRQVCNKYLCLRVNRDLPFVANYGHDPLWQFGLVNHRATVEMRDADKGVIWEGGGVEAQTVKVNAKPMTWHAGWKRSMSICRLCRLKSSESSTWRGYTDGRTPRTCIQGGDKVWFSTQNVTT